MNYEKISPTLALVAEEFQEAGRPALFQFNQTLGLVSIDEAPRPARVVVFLQCEDDLLATAFRKLGVEINQPKGELRTGIVPLAALGRLTDDARIRRVIPSGRLTALMDVAKEKVGVNAFRRASGLSGKGVVVGVVDTGIDTTNQAFTRRILRIWDQTLPGTGVREGPYGVELRGAQLRTSRDTVGHGTHVAGIAASADDTYQGVAPGADLLIVKSDLMTAHIADGIRYIFRVAGEMGRPAVVNLSLGGHGDAHDGTDPLSQIIDAESGPGRIVCCAAGNEGNDNIHAQVVVARNSTRTIACSIPAARPGLPALPGVFNGWYEGRDRLEVAVVPPTGAQTPYQPVITSGPPNRTYQLPHGTVRVVTPGPDPANGDHNFFVLIQPSPSPPPAANPNTWRIRVRGQRITRGGKLDVWVVDRASLFTGRAVQDLMKVGSPGASGEAVTVGSYTTKVEWEDIFGNPQSAGLDLDDISEFSSEGPRRDGVKKPELVAPGAMIVSALGVHAPTPQSVIVDDSNRVMAGTSMACPFVAGLVALLLERDPGLDPKGLKELLRKHTTVPRKRAGAFDAKWGYGLIDATDL